MPLDLILPGDCREIRKPAILKIRGYDSKVFQGMIYVESCIHIHDSLVEGRKGHFAIHIKNLAGRGSIPLQKGTATCNRYGNAKRDECLPCPAMRVQHCEALRWKERMQKHLARFYIHL